jgi:hypothetical protein
MSSTLMQSKIRRFWALGAHVCVAKQGILLFIISALPRTMKFRIFAHQMCPLLTQVMLFQLLNLRCNIRRATLHTAPSVLANLCSCLSVDRCSRSPFCTLVVCVRHDEPRIWVRIRSTWARCRAKDSGEMTKMTEWWSGYSLSKTHPPLRHLERLFGCAAPGAVAGYALTGVSVKYQ